MQALAHSRDCIWAYSPCLSSSYFVFHWQPTYRLELLFQLLRWFRQDFFKWTNSPVCGRCAGGTRSVGGAHPSTPEEVCVLRRSTCDPVYLYCCRWPPTSCHTPSQRCCAPVTHTGSPTRHYPVACCSFITSHTSLQVSRTRISTQSLLRL